MSDKKEKLILKLLDLVPTHIWNPFANQWSFWDSEKTILEYDYGIDEACIYGSSADGSMFVYTTKKGITFCLNGCRDAEGDEPYEIFCLFKDFYVDESNCSITISVDYDMDSVSEICRRVTNCIGRGHDVNCFNKIVQRDDVKLGFSFDSDEFSELLNDLSNESKDNNMTEDDEDIDNTCEKENKNMSNNTNALEGTANNILGKNIEFGPCNDPNLKSTIMGAAVKTEDGSWRVFDKTNGEITDIGNIEMMSLPVYLIPETDLKEGDLIKEKDEYYFVLSISDDNKEITTLSPKTGDKKTAVPIKNILGMSVYSKVECIADECFAEGSDNNKILLMTALMGNSNSSSNQMNQLLPYFMMKNGKIANNKKEIIKMMALTSMGGNNQTNQLLPLLLMSDSNAGESDKMIKMMAMTSMVGNNNGGDNGMMAYLLMKMFDDDANSSKTTKNK